MADISCYGYAEDLLSCAVLRKIVVYQNNLKNGQRQIVFNPGFPLNKRGCGNIKSLIPKICAMATAGIYTVVLTDLDTATCAPDLIRDWFRVNDTHPSIPSNIIFRIAEREVEAWLLADRIALANFLGIAPENFDKSPDQLRDPKQYLLNVIATKGRKKIHREMLPGRNAHVGPEYNPKLCDFVDNYWDINRAVSVSPSLNRAVQAFMRIS